MIHLTVITPTYNSLEFIQKCIENVISQDFDSMEHWIIDGGSTDGTVDVIQKYAAQYPHIKWMSEKDKGQSDALNKGVNLAKGQYLGLLNVDDLYQPNTFHEVFKILETTKSNFIVGNCNIIDEDGKLMYVSKPIHNTLYACYFKQTFPINPSSYFYKRELHQLLGEYDCNDHFGMDLDFFLRYMNVFKKFDYHEKIWGNFNVVESSKTFKDNLEGQMMQRRNELFARYWKKKTRSIFAYFTFF